MSCRCRIETSPLICFANQWTGFCIIRTVMIDSKRCSSTIHQESVLRCSYNSVFFFYLAFLSRKLTIYRTADEGEAISVYPFYHFHLLRRHLDISRVIAAENSHLRIAGSRSRTWNVLYTLFRICFFCTYTGSCCC